MNQEKKISVIIPNYNYGRYLSQAIESVLTQSYTNIELIVVNNGSTDNSLDVLRFYENRIRVIDQANLGQSGARNSGLANATGDLVAFLDADDFWESSKLVKQIALISESAQLVYCGIAPFNDAIAESIPVVLPKHRGDCRRQFIDSPGDSVVLSGESTALFTLELLKKVGSFDYELNSTAGWDFFRRCSRFTNFEFVDEPLVSYRLHDKNMSNSSRNVIKDMRRAYAKTFLESDLVPTKRIELKVLRSLEWSFLKTYLRTRDLRLTIFSIVKLFVLFSKSLISHLLKK
jgi:glycosyltransferase involved in cell wall biosynthesis